MTLMDYLMMENENDFDLLTDVLGETKISVQITFSPPDQIKDVDDKRSYSPLENVDMEIIKHFNKYANRPKITKRIQPEYVYDEKELIKIIIGVNSNNPLHKISFRQLEPDCWEINFEELL